MKSTRLWLTTLLRSRFSLLKRIERLNMENENSLSRRSLLCGLAVLTLGFVPDKAIAASKVKVLANGKVELFSLKMEPEDLLR
jgi:hypothetical protein